MYEPCETQAQVRRFLEESANEAGLSDLTAVALADYLTQKCPLKELREKFAIPKNKTIPGADLSLCDGEEESVYLCGHSLGLMPKATPRIMEEQFQKWADHGVHGHLSEPIPWAYGDECALDETANLVGAKREEVALMNGLTVNIHVILAAFYRPTDERHKILLESRAFPSDHYAVESQIRLHGRSVEESMICMEPREGADCLQQEDIMNYIEEHGHEIAIVWFPGIQYYTGQLFDMHAITKKGHEKGCLVGFDLAHAFVNVPLQLHYWDVDFAAWCSYKYGCTGAGGLAGMFVHERFKNDQRDRMLGWWSHKMSSRFQMNNQLELDEGAAGYRISNPPVHLAVPVLGFLETIKGVTIDDLRKKSFFLTGYMEFLLNYFFAEDSEHRTSKISLKVITPCDFNQRGCQLSLKFSVSIDAIYKELTKRGVSVDKRYPNVIRIAPVHLYNNYRDVRKFVDALAEALQAAEQVLEEN